MGSLKAPVPPLFLSGVYLQNEFAAPFQEWSNEPR